MSGSRLFLVFTVLTLTTILLTFTNYTIDLRADNVRQATSKGTTLPDLRGKKVVVIAASTNSDGDLEEFKLREVAVEVYELKSLLRDNVLDIVDRADAVILDEKTLTTIGRNRGLVEHLLRSGKPLILIARRPVELLLQSYSPEEAPLAVVPVEIDDALAAGAALGRRNASLANATGIRIGLGRDVYAAVIIAHPMSSSTKFPVSYLVYRSPTELTVILHEALSTVGSARGYNAVGVSFAEPTIDSMFTWQGLGSYTERGSITSDVFGEGVGEETIFLHFSYAIDFNHITRPELGLWRVEAIHRVEAVEDSYLLLCYLPGQLVSDYWVGRPSEIVVDVSLFDDQDVIDMWPYSETVGPVSFSVIFIPEAPYVAPSITLTIDSDLYVGPYRMYEYSYYYGYDRVYEAGWKWGEDLPSLFRRDSGGVGVAAYITALKEIPEYGSLGGVYMRITFVGSLVCSNLLSYGGDNPATVMSYAFYVSPQDVQLLGRSVEQLAR